MNNNDFYCISTHNRPQASLSIMSGVKYHNYPSDSCKTPWRRETAWYAQAQLIGVGRQVVPCRLVSQWGRGVETLWVVIGPAEVARRHPSEPMMQPLPRDIWMVSQDQYALSSLRKYHNYVLRNSFAEVLLPRYFLLCDCEDGVVCAFLRNKTVVQRVGSGSLWICEYNIK